MGVLAARAPGAEPSADGAGWTPLFNGRDLSGWTVECVPADRDKVFWKVADEDDGWNDLDVTVTGACVRARLNGVPVTDLKGAGILDDPAHRARNVGAAGHIALQLHRGDELKIEFKDVFVREPVGRK